PRSFSRLTFRGDTAKSGPDVSDRDQKGHREPLERIAAVHRYASSRGWPVAQESVPGIVGLLDHDRLDGVTGVSAIALHSEVLPHLALDLLFRQLVDAPPRF